MPTRTSSGRPARRATPLALLIVAALVLAVGAERTEATPGFSSPAVHGWSTSVEPSVPFTDGLEVLEPTGSVEIVDVRIDADDGLRLLGAQLVGPDRPMGAVQHLPGFPPSPTDTAEYFGAPADVRDAAGTTLAPRTDPDGTRRSWELLLGLEATRPGTLVGGRSW
ncbi:hypothetical protein ACFT5B_08820 [Luteimicrobium sp. NPDC057192]|uniref:hypothetical protein n=1 Tax=Luteimicrobium sp. NPDC057192 TaxID=3346042 RepID=UPI00362667F8